MAGRTHLLAAAAAAMLFAVAAGLRGVEAAVALLAGLAAGRLPDADLRRGHRVLLHNLPVAVTLTLLAYYALSVLLGEGLALAAAGGLAAGYLSHILLDAFTVSGVAILYPFTRRRFRVARLRSSDPLANALASAASLALFLLAAYRVAMG